MSFELQVEEIEDRELQPVEYRWDADTDILSATLRASGVSEGLSGSVDIQGADGAWLLLELSAGRLVSLEVAVWPDVRTVEPLPLPPASTAARVRVPSRQSISGTEALEVEAAIQAVTNRAESTIHFRIGAVRPSRALRIAHDLLVELDSRSRFAGFWLLNVPPFPTTP